MIGRPNQESAHILNIFFLSHLPFSTVIVQDPKCHQSLCQNEIISHERPKIYTEVLSN